MRNFELSSLNINKKRELTAFLYGLEARFALF